MMVSTVGSLAVPPSPAVPPSSAGGVAESTMPRSAESTMPSVLRSAIAFAVPQYSMIVSTEGSEVLRKVTPPGTPWSLSLRDSGSELTGAWNAAAFGSPPSIEARIRCDCEL